jgi:hypothetical protein
MAGEFEREVEEGDLTEIERRWIGERLFIYLSRSGEESVP